MSTIKCISLIIFFWIINVFAQQTSPLTFSEVMFYPSESNGEFIEIYNTSLTETIEIANYKIKYYTSANNNLVPLAGGTKLGPGKFAVILQGNYDYNNGIYKTLIPSDAIVLKVSSNNFGTSGMANTTSRTVYLIDPSGQTVDTYTYSADNSSGISDEKIILNKDNSSSNWKNSFRTHGTPGFKNSVSPVDYDLQIEFLNLYPSMPRAEDSLQISFVVINKGRLKANNFFVSIFNDVNYDSIEQSNENIFYQNISELNSGDSIVIQKSIYIETANSYAFIAEVNFSLDELLTNNRATFNITVEEKLASYNDIVINEIMYAPINDEPEWIELYNRSNRKVNLKNWKIGDNSSSIIITSNDLLLDSGQYLIISKDASINNFYNITSQLIIKQFPTLNNAGDDVILRDDVGRTIDSLRYNPSWGGNSDKSLERISASESSLISYNWGNSVSKEKATPGKINSLTQKDLDLSIKSFYSESQYAVVNKELLLKVEIENKGRNAAQNAILKLYKDINNDSVGNESEILKIIDLQTIFPDETLTLEINIDAITLGENNFILLIDFSFDEFNDNNLSTYKINGIEFKESIYDIVVNEIMYAPKGDEPEWIELYNRSNHSINLRNWQIGDSSTLTEITAEDYELMPDEFLVITKDSLIVNFYSTITKFIICPLPTLNNDGDVLIVKDKYNRTIDSIRYLTYWGGSNGKSLERKSVDLSSIDKDNWNSSLSKYNGTPGKVNSISLKDYDISIISFSSKSHYAEIGKSLVINAVIKNLGKQKAENVEIQIYKDENVNNSIDEPLLERKEINFIESNQDLQIEFVVQNISLGKNQFILSIDFSMDEFEENNIAFFTINGVERLTERGDVVINEIMYAPNAPEPEWIELYNRSDKAINMKGFKISNGREKSEIAVERKIEPQEYLVITSDTIIKSIYGIEKLLINKLPVMSNSGSIIEIRDSLDRVIDSLKYSAKWGGERGKSLERIDENKSSTDSTNWKTSISERGTPGRKNSVSKKDYDLMISSYSITPDKPQIGDKIKLAVVIKNQGKNKQSGKLIVSEFNNDFKIHLETITLPEINSFDSVSIGYDFELLTNKKFYLMLENTNDEDISNNELIFTVYPAYKQGAILINEIMFNPINGEPEWIELYNNSNYQVELEGWSISDLLSTPVQSILNAGKIFPHSLFVIVKDSSIIHFHNTIPSGFKVNLFANLNNDSDAVIIKDFYGNIIDSVFYQKKTVIENGKSLERKSIYILSSDKNNWDYSKDAELSTPGRTNSISKKNVDIFISDLWTEPKHPFINDEVYLYSKVINKGMNAINNIMMKFFVTSDNQLVLFDELIIKNLLPDDSLIVKSNKKLNLSGDTKIFSKVYLQNDEDTSNNYLTKEIRVAAEPKSILINEIMFNPRDDEPEWFEIVNVSNYPVNLKDWYVSDIYPYPTKVLITNNDYYLQPNEYLVITNDISKYSSESKVIQVKFPALNNSYDGIIIYDYKGKIIDSVYYESNDGETKGISIERINSSLSDSTFWLPSLSEYGSTPGYKNSFVNLPELEKNSIVINEIMYEPEKNNTEFIEFFNTKNDSLQIGGLTLTVNQKTLRLITKYYKIAPKSYFIVARDSALYKYYSLKHSENTFINNSLTLPDDGTQLILKDVNENVIDSIWYLPQWHNKNIYDVKNKSLERINPYLNSTDKSNWSTSVSLEGATPLKQNSIYTTILPSKSKVTISPNPFSPDNDGFEDFTIINFNLAYKISQVRLRVYDSQGRLVRTLENNLISSSNNSLIFDGLDDNGRPLRIGIYILLVEIVSQEGSTEIHKMPFVIARKL